ncbi:hypothetical protein PAXINDRAFT_168683 [Paxillus involutus ATCC 200175]|nr:hypothetical protein PAXINDRAFT_168683 [Paxillus involutus ATCC 200175]
MTSWLGGPRSLSPQCNQARVFAVWSLAVATAGGMTTYTNGDLSSLELLSLYPSTDDGPQVG